MNIVVLGAGIIGVTTAWYLRQQGHDVRVVERHPASALETSFANAGQISAHLADPWSNPSMPRNLLSWLFRDDAPLVFHPRASVAQWTWLVKFLAECVPSRYHRNLMNLARLGVYSRTALQELRAETGIRYDHHEGGILLFFTDAAALSAASAAATRLKDQGFVREIKSADECVAIEPALAAAKSCVRGGIYSPRDETGDAFKFTRALAEMAVQAGVQFDYGATIRRIVAGGDRIEGVAVEREGGVTETVRADHYVLALGCRSPEFARKLGIGLDIYPVKGYSVTFPVKNAEAAYKIGLTDAGRKLAFSRLGDRLRATAIAEIDDFNTRIDVRRCEAIVRRTMELFPGAADAGQAQYWAGLRPMTPSNLPYIGRTRYRNLFLNSGHGTVGWTQSCGSARALAEIIGGGTPDLDFPFQGVGRD